MLYGLPLRALRLVIVTFEDLSLRALRIVIVAFEYLSLRALMAGMMSTLQSAGRVERGELFINVGMLHGWRKSIGEGSNSWRGLYPRVRSFIVLKLTQ